MDPGIIILIIIFAIVGFGLLKTFASTKELICTACGTVGSGKDKAAGSFLIEVILWICFIVPGLIYSIWRLSSGNKVCTACGNPTLIPTDTPKGQELLKQRTR